MKKCLLLGLMVLSLNCFSQNRNSIWCFGDSSGIDFNNINNPVAFASGMDGRGSCTSIADSSGQLLFYANTIAGTSDWSTVVFNSNHQLMENGDTIIGDSWQNELVIIPNPGTTNEYYLFSMGETSAVPQKGFFYSKINMSLNGGLGRVVQKNVRLNTFRNADCVTAIKHGNGRDWWAISKYSTNNTNFNRTYVYLVTNDSIHSPIIQNLNDATDGDVQRIIFNSNGTKFMQINAAGYMAEYEFDRCSGIISNPQIIFPEQSGPYNRTFWNGAYSPDNSKFYVSTELYDLSINDTSWLVQYNLISSNIPGSADTLFWAKQPIQGGALRLAPDGKVYYSCAYAANISNGYPYPDSIRFQSNENLSVINFPDSVGASCNFQPFSFYLGGKRTYWGLPNNPNYDLGPLIGSGCDTLTSISPSPSIKQASLNVYYHPSWQTLFVNAQNVKGKNCLLQIFDMNGRCVFTFHDKAVNGYFTYDVPLQTTANGIYILKLTTDKETLTTKFVKQ